MPRKTKESIEEKQDVEKKSTTKKASPVVKKSTAKKATKTAKKVVAKEDTTAEKKSVSKKASTTTAKKTTTKKETTATKKSTSKKETDVAKKGTTKKEPTVAKKVTTKKEPVVSKDVTNIEESPSTKKTTTKKTSTKKTSTKKATDKKTATTKSTTKKKPAVEEIEKKETKSTKKTTKTNKADKSEEKPKKENKTSTKSVKTTKAEKKESSKISKTAKVEDKKATKSSKASKTAKSKKEDDAKTETKSKRGRKPKKLDIDTSVTAIPMEVEYYDLPYKYNETIVNVLYQNPTTLFVYWEISDNDIENYKKMYGENFFETTEPILTVYNDTMNYKFEIVMNDFANSWYFNIKDIKCDYRVELGRRPRNNNYNNDYIYITSSNTIESPNDRILFNTNEDNSVYFRNVQNNTYKKIQVQQILKQLNLKNKKFGFPLIKDLPDLYETIFKLDNISEFDTLSNPSSGNPSSESLSSRFN